MNDQIAERLSDLGRRCGLKDASPRVVAAFLVVAVVAVCWAAWRWWPHGSPPAEPTASQAETAAEPSAPAAASQEATSVPELLVHVVGAVRHPGVYSLTQGARVRDAVELAGGMMPNASPAAVNLARPVADGEQVLIPTTDEVAAGVSPGGVAGGGSAGAGAAGGGAGGTGAANAAGKVNINTADLALLDTLPGIGPSTAQKIVADREANGPFKSVEDLGRISGIGPKRIEQLKDVACVQ